MRNNRDIHVITGYRIDKTPTAAQYQHLPPLPKWEHRIPSEISLGFGFKISRNREFPVSSIIPSIVAEDLLGGSAQLSTNTFLSDITPHIQQINVLFDVPSLTEILHRRYLKEKKQLSMGTTGYRNIGTQPLIIGQMRVESAKTPIPKPEAIRLNGITPFVRKRTPNNSTTFEASPENYSQSFP